MAHNVAAGSDQGVAAARSFGDLSHAVFVPVKPNGAGAGELLIIDYWNSLDGLQYVLLRPAGPAGRRDGLSRPRGGGLGAHRPACRASTCRRRPAGTSAGSASPAGRSPRVEAAEKHPDRDDAQARQHRPRQGPDVARMVLPPRAARARSRRSEVIGVDVWFDADGMQEVYSDPAEMEGLAGLFTAPPETSAWQKPKGAWVEW